LVSFFFETTKLEPDWLFSDKKNFFPARFAAIPDFRLKLTEYEKLQHSAATTPKPKISLHP
jgi:hypothetical protein